jgi:trehalose 6-phosphate phosphatase
VGLHDRVFIEFGAAFRDIAPRLLRQHGDALRLIPGKMVVEFQPRHHGKGSAIAAFMEEPPFRGRVPVFLGDDTTDEEGFAEVNRRGGISIRVGPSGDSAAIYELPSVSAVLDWLAGTPANRS